MVLKAASLPENIVKPRAEGVNQIFRNAKLRGARNESAKTLVAVAEGESAQKDAADGGSSL